MNWKYPESKVKVERNNRTKKIIQIQERIPSWETWKIQRYYTEQDIIVHAIWINLIVVTWRLEYTTRWPRVLSIDDWSMRISRNISWVSVDISDVSKRIESKNPKWVQSWFREWAVLRWAIRFNVWYWLDIVLNETNYELWVSAKWEVKTQKL